eukprot:1617070-Prymnesium_polylepis.1
MAQTVERVVRLHKPSPTAMVGMTLAMFTKEGDNPDALPRIHHLHEQGLARASGQLMVDDILVSVNGKSASNDAIASSLIRDAVGDVLLKVRR